MNFLLLNQFYPPDVAPTGQFLHDVARAFVARGHGVKVICSRRAYEGGENFPSRHVLDGVDIVRIAAPGYGRRSFLGKLADYAGFAAGLAFSVLSERPRPDLVLSLTTPPFLGLAGREAASIRGCRHAHWIMDVYPDVLAAHGMIAAGGAAERALSALARAELRGSALTLALGPVIARRVEAHAGGPVPWVPLWSASALRATADESAFAREGSAGQTTDSDLRDSDERSSSSSRASASALRASADKPADKSAFGGDAARDPASLRAERGWGGDLVLMYSGNMGLGHRFGEFLEAARRLGPSSAPSGLRRVRWAFCGGGARRGEVEAFARAHPEARVELHPYVARERLGEALAAGDVHLASLDAGWQGLMVPSKIQGIFAAGRPVIFVGGGENEIAGWIREAGAGWVVAENDVEGLIAAVEEAKDAGRRASCGAAARRFAEVHFDPVTNVARICAMLERAAKG